MSALLVTLGGLLAIAVIVWWFWLSVPHAATAADRQTIIRVEGGAYQPAVVTTAAAQPLTLRFLRLDASPCAEQVTFASLNITADLPIGHAVEVKLPALPAGIYEFTCQMGMYRGRVLVQ